MGIQLDWREESWEEPPAGGQPAADPTPRRPRRPLLAAAALLTLTLLALLSGWWTGNRREARQALLLADEIDALLVAERAAFLAGDVDVRLAFHDPDPAWQAAQFLPYQQTPLAAGQRVDRVEDDGNLLWATLAWDTPSGPATRVAFFRRTPNGLQRVASEPAYWGGLRQTEQRWGSLRLSRADADFHDAIADFISRTAAANCDAPCPALTVIVDAGFAPATTAGTVRVPSPQLVGLDAAGQPGAPFWAVLGDALRAATEEQRLVRFGVPDESTAAAYRPLAAMYAAANPGHDVEIVVAPDLLTDPAAALSVLDGALLFPTAELIATGHVADLTSYVYDATGFDQGDFYAQIWDGGWWRERMWAASPGSPDEGHLLRSGRIRGGAATTALYALDVGGNGGRCGRLYGGATGRHLYHLRLDRQWPRPALRPDTNPGR